MFKFGNFPSKVPNNIDKKIIKYDNTLHYCYSPELPYINKKELNQQAVDDVLNESIRTTLNAFTVRLIFCVMIFGIQLLAPNVID